MTFFVERFNGDGWTCLMQAQHYVNPHAVTGPPEHPFDGITTGGLYPPARTAGNASAFAGKPGWKARVRFNDDVMETYVWEKIPENPADEMSPTVWGWKLSRRFRVPITAAQVALGEFSVF